jgi:hypothetical protein
MSRRPCSQSLHSGRSGVCNTPSGIQHRGCLLQNSSPGFRAGFFYTAQRTQARVRAQAPPSGGFLLCVEDVLSHHDHRHWRLIVSSIWLAPWKVIAVEKIRIQTVHDGNTDSRGNDESHPAIMTCLCCSPIQKDIRNKGPAPIRHPSSLATEAKPRKSFHSMLSPASCTPMTDRMQSCI